MNVDTTHLSMFCFHNTICYYFSKNLYASLYYDSELKSEFNISNAHSNDELECKL